MKEYKGTTYIGVVGSEIGISACQETIEKIVKRQDDSGPYYARATKGYDARQKHLNNFIEQGQAFILLLDSDMYFSPDTLERLRSHKLPYVSGLYMRRKWENLGPVWYRKFPGKWPMEPWVGKIEEDKLHELGASGWGCMLVHRDVILETRKILKTEPEVIEDDMDIFPYDIKQIMRAINNIDRLAQSNGKIDPLFIKPFVEILKEEIKPLRCDRSVVGSDIRFPFFASLAGFQLMGDPSVAPGHNIQFPLNAEMYHENFTDEQFELGTKEMHKETMKARKSLARKVKAAQNA